MPEADTLVVAIGGGVFQGDTTNASDDYAASCGNQARGPDEAYALGGQTAAESYLNTERILEVLKRSDGQQFDQHLVRRFAQLIGIYPAGNLVRLNTGEIAVVMKVYAPDPHRPQVKVVVDRTGAKAVEPAGSAK